MTRSITNLEVISPQNKIQPLTTKHKAPFEQTFRLTVYLPHGQLYVARMGAKTKLVELLDTICTDKLLDPNKFDFRHPGTVLDHMNKNDNDTQSHTHRRNRMESQ